MTDQKGLITKKDLNSVFLRTATMQFPYNYEKMQAVGYLICMKPVLKRLYSDADLETRQRAMHRHMEFFNSHLNANGLILGITAALEEKTSEDEKLSISTIKTGLMGPLAGIGDSLMKFTWLPICASIGASFALEGNIMGPIIMFLMYNIVNFLTRYYGVHKGYEKGISFIEENSNNNIIQRISNMANVVGLMVVGALIATSVKVNIGLEIPIGESSLVIQEMVDKIMPNLLPLLTTLGFYSIFKKSNGKHTPIAIFGTMIISIGLVYFGILA